VRLAQQHSPRVAVQVLNDLLKLYPSEAAAGEGQRAAIRDRQPVQTVPGACLSQQTFGAIHADGQRPAARDGSHPGSRASPDIQERSNDTEGRNL
jgi:hypothetical protein